MEQTLIVIVGSLLAILSAIHLFILSDLKKEMKFNRDDFYEKIERVIRLWEKRNEQVDKHIESLCRAQDQQGLLLREHSTLLKLDYPTRKELIKESAQ